LALKSRANGPPHTSAGQRPTNDPEKKQAPTARPMNGGAGSFALGPIPRSVLRLGRLEEWSVRSARGFREEEGLTDPAARGAHGPLRRRSKIKVETHDGRRFGLTNAPGLAQEIFTSSRRPRLSSRRPQLPFLFEIPKRMPALASIRGRTIADDLCDQRSESRSANSVHRPIPKT